MSSTTWKPTSASERVLVKIASQDASLRTLVAACLMNKEAGYKLMKSAEDAAAAPGSDKSWGEKLGENLSAAGQKIGDWWKERGWQDLATAGVTGGAAYGASWLVPGLRKKHLLQALIGAAAAGAGGYYGKEIRDAGETVWNGAKDLYNNVTKGSASSGGDKKPEGGKITPDQAHALYTVQKQLEAAKGRQQRLMTLQPTADDLKSLSGKK